MKTTAGHLFHRMHHDYKSSTTTLDSKCISFKINGISVKKLLLFFFLSFLMLAPADVTLVKPHWMQGEEKVAQARVSVNTCIIWVKKIIMSS